MFRARIVFAALLVALVVVAACSPKTHTVTVTYVPDGGQLAMDVPVEAQKTQVEINSNSPHWYPPTPHKLGFTFVNWYLDADLTQLYSAKALTDNRQITLYAKYISSEQDEFFVVSFISHGGTFTPNQLTARGDQLQRPADPDRAGYVFRGWEYEVSPSGAAGPVDFTRPIEENLVLGAIYEKK